MKDLGTFRVDYDLFATDLTFAVLEVSLSSFTCAWGSRGEKKQSVEGSNSTSYFFKHLKFVVCCICMHEYYSSLTATRFAKPSRSDMLLGSESIEDHE